MVKKRDFDSKVNVYGYNDRSKDIHVYLVSWRRLAVKDLVQ